MPDCACGKRAYTTRQGASDAARKMDATRKRDHFKRFGSTKMDHYHCPDLPSVWHIGHGSKTGRGRGK